MNSRQRRKLRRFSESMYLGVEYAVRAHKARLQQKTEWLDARPWIDVTGDGEVPAYMLSEKAPPQNGHDMGKVVASIFKSLDSGKASFKD